MIVKRNNRRKDKDNFQYFSELAMLNKKRKLKKRRVELVRNIGLVIFIGILILMCLKFSNFL